jgi:hypothetical protein
MCGLVGIIAKESEELGSSLISMLKEIEHRGSDATGFAVYENRNDIQLRASFIEEKCKDPLLEIIAKYGTLSDSRMYRGVGIFSFYECSIDMPESEIQALHNEIDSSPELCVHSIGKHIKVYKDQGTARDLERSHQFSLGAATHGIGHVRLATESLENINFAHPFISEQFPELCIVHNGQFTNYFNMRRSLENRGITFKTNNDSELAVQFLGFHMKENGGDLELSIKEAMNHFDGVFTIIASTHDQVGIFRDTLGMKPVLYFQTDDGSVLLGSEEISLAKIAPDVSAIEMDPGGVKVWRV